uniref:Uncharacterized protein n=1 Tax=Octopus bimaculoides TaxID=37653 RepID=A0A0L8HRS0_OCTBM
MLFTTMCTPPGDLLYWLLEELNKVFSVTGNANNIADIQRLYFTQGKQQGLIS